MSSISRTAEEWRGFALRRAGAPTPAPRCMGLPYLAACLAYGAVLALFVPDAVEPRPARLVDVVLRQSAGLGPSDEVAAAGAWASRSAAGGPAGAPASAGRAGLEGLLSGFSR